MWHKPEDTTKRKDYPDHPKISDALNYITQTQLYYVLDSLHCTLHNEGQSLKGNRPENDAQWLADGITRRSLFFGQKSYEMCTPDSQKEALAIAEVVIELLPQFSDRMASRYLALKSAIESTQEMMRAKKRIRRELE